MHHPQIVIYESTDGLAALVTELARDHRWLVREVRDPEACVQLLRDARPTILLLKLERKLIDELRLLSTVCERAPDCPVAVFSDIKFDTAMRTGLAGLAYDLGARYVLFPPLMRTSVEDLAVGLMEATIRRLYPGRTSDGAK